MSLTDDVQRHADVPALVLDSEEKHNDGCTDCAHERVIEHLHGETPFQSQHLLLHCLFRKLAGMVPGVREENIFEIISDGPPKRIADVHS